MKKGMLFLVALVAVVFASCQTTLPGTATANAVGTKVGTAKQAVLFGIFPLGDADSSIQKAAENGGIKKISTVDHRVITPASPLFAGFYYELETVVTGN